MADLDAELLALAGGDSSDEEEAQAPSSDTQGSSATLQATDNITSKNESTSNKLNTTSRPSITVNGASSKDMKKSRKNDSEEEGEASPAPASPGSQQSVSMSESDSDSAPAGNAGNGDLTLFPVDNQFYSQKDKREIMAMSEVQRESILAERAGLRDRQAQDQQLRRLLQAREKADAKPDKKRKAGTAELEDSPARKSSRQKTTLGGRKVGETSGAIEAYKRQREEKGLRDEQRRLEGEERRRKLRDSPLEKYSEADADGESEVEWDDRAKSAQPTRDEEPAQLIDFEHVRVGRDNFAKVCFYPGFDHAITNCYARVSIGPDRVTGENVYRMAKIKGFTEGKPYAMDGVNGKPFTTSQYAVIAFGKAEKPWPFIACSNAKFTVAEFQTYAKAMAEDDLPLPTKPVLISKVGDINKLLNHSWTEEEINEKLRRQGVTQSRFAHIEREDISRRRKIAVDRGDESAIAKLDAELAALDGPKLAFGTKLHKAAPEAPKQEMSQQERLAELNRINRKKNIEEVRKAQRAERKAQLLAAKAVERGEAVQDPFARVQTRARTHYDVNKDNLGSLKPPHSLDDLFDGGSNTSRAGTPMSNGANTPKRAVTPKPPQAKAPPKVGGLPTIGTRNMDDDIIAAMDLGIEIDI